MGENMADNEKLQGQSNETTSNDQQNQEHHPQKVQHEDFSLHLSTPKELPKVPPPPPPPGPAKKEG
jgi:hypothetical protein